MMPRFGYLYIVNVRHDAALWLLVHSECTSGGVSAVTLEGVSL